MSIWQPGDTLSSFYTRNAAAIRAALSISTSSELDAQYAPLGAARIGTGAPNGSVVGSVGDRYIDRAATLGARVWRKATGDATNTGWLVVEGDTGWRNLTASATNVDSGNIHMRRIGNDVHLNLTALSLSASGTTNVLVAPTGFGFDGFSALWFSYQWVLRADSSTNQVCVQGIGGNQIRLVNAPNGSAYAASDSFRGVIVYRTEDAWPASLPGTAS